MASTPKQSDLKPATATDDDNRDTDSGDPTSLDVHVSLNSDSPAISRDTERDLEDLDLAPNSRSVTARSRTEILGKPDKTDKAGEDKEDTLLSVDEDAGDAVVSERSNQAVEELERRVVQLEARIQVMEMQRGARPGGERRWLFWVGLLLALGLGWQLRAFFH